MASSIEMNLSVARNMVTAGMPSIVKGVCETLLRLMSHAEGAIFEGVTSADAVIASRSWTSECLTSIETFAGEGFSPFMTDSNITQPSGAREHLGWGSFSGALSQMHI